MNTGLVFRAMLRGGIIGGAIFVVLLVIISLFPSLERTIIAHLVWDIPVPTGIIEKTIAAMFGAHTDERGLVIVLAVVGFEYALCGVIVGLLIFFIRVYAQRGRAS